MKKKRWILSLGIAAVMLTLIVSAIGGTLAYLIAETDSITNVFELGDITYELVLKPNPPEGYIDDDVTMPTLSPGSPKTEASGSVTFTLSGEPALTGYKFLGWFTEGGESGTELYDANNARTIEVGYGDPHTVTEGDKVSLTLYAHWEITVSFLNSFAETPTPELPEGVIPGEEAILITEMPDMAELEADMALEGMELCGWLLEGGIGSQIFESIEELEETLYWIFEDAAYYGDEVELLLTPLYKTPVWDIPVEEEIFAGVIEIEAETLESAADSEDEILMEEIPEETENEPVAEDDLIPGIEEPEAEDSVDEEVSESISGSESAEDERDEWDEDEIIIETELPHEDSEEEITAEDETEEGGPGR